MCFSARISLVTYIVCLLGCARLFVSKRQIEAIIFAWIIQMQLVEFFIWNDRPCTSSGNETNRIASRVGLMLHNTQPIILWIAIYLYSARKLPRFLHILQLFYIFCTIYYILDTYKTLQCTTVTVWSSPHLHWKWTYGNYHIPYYFLYFLLYILLTYYGVTQGYYLITLYVVSYVITWYIYRNTHAVGSMWCFIGASAPWILSILYSFS